MVLSSPDARQDGYATAAATLLALAIGVTVAAVVASALNELRLERRSFERRQAELALAGAQMRAVSAVLVERTDRRLRWQISEGSDNIEILAEPEAAKLGLAAATDVDIREFDRFGVVDSAQLQGRLVAMSAAKGVGAFDIAAADGAADWRTCAGSMISPYGKSDRLSLHEAATPTASRDVWRVAQVWRIRATSSKGWTDDRIVRFTGDGENPAAVVERQFSSTGRWGEPCGRLVQP